FDEHRTVFMVGVCLDTTITTTKCSRYVFRPFDYAPAQAVAFAPYLVSKLGKKWHIAYLDYAWGQSTRDAYAAEIKKLGGEVVGTTGIPLGTADMTSFLSKISGSFDGFFGIFFGANAVVLATQAYDLGLTKKYRFAGDGAVAREPVLLGETEVVGLRGQDDGVGAEEDPEEPVETAADLRKKRGHVGRAQRNPRRADDLSAQLLDLGGVGVAGRLTPGVVEVGDVPLLAQLADEVRGEGDRLGGRVVERSEDVPAALRRRDGGVKTDADHEDGPVLVEDRHAGHADVGEIAALGHVDLVLHEELLHLAAADIRLGLVVGHDRLQRPAVDASRLVDPVDGHHRSHQGRLSAGRGDAGERLHDPDLVGLRLAERLAPRRRNQHGRAERGGGRGRQSEKAPPRGLAAPP